MTPGIVFEIELDERTRARNAAAFHNPGDKVRPRAAAGELAAAAAAAGATVLTVRNLIVGETVRYAFEEIPGTFGANQAIDARELLDGYGVAVPDGDGGYAVQYLTDGGEASGPIRRLDGTVERAAAWNVGDTLDKIIGEDGASGEFVLAETPGGYALVGVPWNSEASPAEREAALQALRAEAGPRP